MEASCLAKQNLLCCSEVPGNWHVPSICTGNGCIVMLLSIIKGDRLYIDLAEQ